MTRVPAWLLAVGLASAAMVAQARVPDIDSCPPPEQPEGGEISRTEPIPIPPRFRSIVRSSRYSIAIATLGGATICRDTSWTQDLEDMTLSPDGRFLTYGWMGYETYGQDLVDRTGKGVVIEVGQPPVFSPSRRLFAAIDLNEGEIGTLTGLAVWRVERLGATQIGKIETIPQLSDWRIDGWVGEACLNLSARPHGSDETARRMRYTARKSARGWRLARAPAGCRRR
jgi:hypothetical protein